MLIEWKYLNKYIIVDFFFHLTDLKLTPWPDESDENGAKCRTITYTLSLNYHIGPKSTLSIEKQVFIFFILYVL